MTKTPLLSATETLAILIHRHPKGEQGFPAVRVSTAQQNSCRYPYWGAVRYRIRLTDEGDPIAVPMERASRDRRTETGAWRDAMETGRYLLSRGPGRLSESECADILASEQFSRWRHEN